MVNKKGASLSHNLHHEVFSDSLKRREGEIRKRGENVERQLQVLQELSTFDLGKFLIQNRGLNGYWTDYVLMFPKRKVPCQKLEHFFLSRAPTALATQERFDLFQKELQKGVRDGVVMASIPCGVMSELLTLDFSKACDVTLIGSDIDEDSLQWAKRRTREVGFAGKVILRRDDAWNFKLPQQVDVLTSNGLNIYEKDEKRVVALYRSFYEQIKSGGLLVTSFLTPQESWRMDRINCEDLLCQKEMFVDVIGVGWQSFTSEEKTRSQLESVGFVDVTVIPDRANLFPTVTAKRPQN